MIRSMEITDIYHVSKIHKEVLESPLSKIADGYCLEGLYLKALFIPEAKGWVAVENEKIVGFALATSNLHVFDKKMNLKFLSKVYIVAHFVMNPRNFIEFIRNRIFHLITTKMYGPLGYLLTIGVSKEYQGKEIGSALFKEAYGWAPFSTDTLADNFQSRRFYRKMGLREIDQYLGSVFLSR